MVLQSLQTLSFIVYETWRVLHQHGGKTSSNIHICKQLLEDQA